MKILFLSFTCEDIGVGMVTNFNFDLLEQKIISIIVFISPLYPSLITFFERHFAIGGHFNYTILLFRK